MRAVVKEHQTIVSSNRRHTGSPRAGRFNSCRSLVRSLVVWMLLPAAALKSEAVSVQEVYDFPTAPSFHSAPVQGKDGAFYGTIDAGGEYGLGTVYRVATNGLMTTLLSFQGTNGANPNANLLLGSDGALYGTTANGGVGGVGTVFRITTAGELATLGSFDVSGGAAPYAGLIEGSDRAFYGTTSSGAENGNGTVFRITTNGNLTMLAAFSGTNGIFPEAALTRGSDGAFYGTTSSGGTSGTVGWPDGSGAIFRVTTSGELTSLTSFAHSNGASPLGNLVQGGDGAFYGTTYYTEFDGATDCYAGDGTIFRVTTNGELTTLVWFTETNGSGPWGSLLGIDGGTFYGTTQYGGENGWGTLFRVTTNGALTTLAAFDLDQGGAPRAGLTQGNDGAFYGTTECGGANDYGTVFRATTNGAVTALASFDASDGADSHGGLVRGSDGMLYGTTRTGGRYNGGTVFQLKPGGNFRTLLSFNPQQKNECYAPYAGLVQGSDGALYGTSRGGTYGTVFRVTTNGQLTILASFTVTNGWVPSAGLVQGSDGAFYGTTVLGGSSATNHLPSGFGTVFRITTNGELTLLASFGCTNGAFPFGGLVQGGDGALYGTTLYGGGDTVGPYSGFGTLFRVTTNAELKTLVRFGGTNVAYPLENLVWGEDGMLYGLAQDSLGAVFRATTNGDLTTLAAFTFQTGWNPRVGLIRGRDGAFYGATMSGGAQGYGTVFRVTTNGVLTTLLSLGALEGNPASSLVQLSDGTFYGTSASGGRLGGGTIFRVIVDPELQPPTREGDAWKIKFSGTPGGTYRLQRAPNPAGPWETLASPAAGADGTGQYSDLFPPPDCAFYRIASP
jgi:uncharacterized repeat protein (TIGR03803 family)